MGTDINLITEYRDVNGKWHFADVFPNRKRYDWSESLYPDSLFLERDYTMFAILGNVQNGHGFAGVYTHDPLPFISDCRGIPNLEADTRAAIIYPDDDHDEDAWENDDIVWMGDHSFSWVTFAEYLAYDWERPMQSGGVVTMAALKEWTLEDKDHQRPPPGWSGGISGPNIEIVSEDEGRKRIAEGNIHKDLYAECRWGQAIKYRVAASDETIRSNAIRRLRHFGIPEDEPERLRFVFGFDS